MDYADGIEVEWNLACQLDLLDGVGVLRRQSSVR